MNHNPEVHEVSDLSDRQTNCLTIVVAATPDDGNPLRSRHVLGIIAEVIEPNHPKIYDALGRLVAPTLVFSGITDLVDLGLLDLTDRGYVPTQRGRELANPFPNPQLASDIQQWIEE